ncbi:MAG: 50S ribosomal protein L11 methyltransferase [Bacteroidota bacterium]
MIELSLELGNAELMEILIAELEQLGFESFWEEDKILRAYISSDQFSEEKLRKLMGRYQEQGITHFSWTTLQAKTWLKAREDRYPPLYIKNQLLVIDPSDTFQARPPYQIQILTALSFGSGAHPSTELCLRMMLEISFERSSILDLGCGTGVLALLAELMGGAYILAMDNNPWAIEVCRENLKINQSTKIDLRLGSIASLSKGEKFDFILANLNASVLEKELHLYPDFLAPNAQIILGGYMEKDKGAIDGIATRASLLKIQERTKEGWIVGLFQFN